MSKKILNYERCNNLIEEFEKLIEKPRKEGEATYYTGIDLGTSCVILTVFNGDGEVVGGNYRYADIVRDGMIVDFIGAIDIVRELKEDLEEKLDAELNYGAIAIPPGTESIDAGVVANVVESAGFQVVNSLDEPTAANELLEIKDGAVVDIGGGTTGISILKDGKVVYVADEATGGRHFSLVISGAYKMSMEEAESFKKNEENHEELLIVLKPVVEKVASIINQHVKGYDVEEISLVGGTSCLNGIEKIIEKETGIPTYKPSNPMFVTPLGIGLSCFD